MRLRLRQRIECGRFGDAPPAPLPADLAGLWDAFVDCGDLLFCLVARPDEPSSFDAVTCFDPGFAWWSVRCADHPGGPADADVVVEVTHHAVSATSSACGARRTSARRGPSCGGCSARRRRCSRSCPGGSPGRRRATRPGSSCTTGGSCCRWCTGSTRGSGGTSPSRAAARPAMLAAARRPRRRRRASKVRARVIVVRQAPHRQVRRKRRHRPVGPPNLPGSGSPTTSDGPRAHR